MTEDTFRLSPKAMSSNLGVNVVAAMMLLVWAPHLPLSVEQAANPEDSFETSLHQGFERHQKNEYAAAVPVLQQAWNLRPHDYFANLLLGIDLLRTGQTAEAIPHLHEAAHQKPQEEFAYEYLGEAYAGLGDYAAAFRFYRRAVMASPHSAEAKAAFVRYGLTRFAKLSAQMRSSKPSLAAEYRLQAVNRSLDDPSRVDLLERATKLSDDVDTWAQLALTRIRLGNVAEGGEALAHAHKLSTNNLCVLEGEALLAAKTGDWNTAGRLLGEIASRSPAALARMLFDWPAALQPIKKEMNEVATEFLDCVAKSCGTEGVLRRLPQPAVRPGASASSLYREQRWERLVRLAPPSRAAKHTWFERGVALAEIGNCDEAVFALERSLAPNDTIALTMFHLSRCYAEEADRAADELSKSEGNEALVHIIRGDVLLRLQANGKAAMDEYQAAVAERRDDPVTWERLAEAQLAAGSPDDARQSAQNALRLDDHRLDAMRTLAQAAMEERNYAEALPFLRELTKQNPGDLGLRAQLSTACSQEGKLDEAFLNLEVALKGGYPDEKGNLHYQLGAVLRGLGRNEESQAAFEEARKLADRFQNTTLRATESKQ